MKKEWRYKNTNTNEKSLLKRLLESRGITEEQDIKEFLSPTNEILTSPYAFSDMEKAVNRLEQSIINKKSIVIYGDFDADGVTSTSILYKALQHLEADVHYYIPSREDEGHGLDTSALTKLMVKNKPDVLITVDCGISNVVEVNFIKSFGVDVIISDHHEAPEVLPNAYAIINPKAPNSLDENLSAKQITYLTYLAGCGVAFKIAQALLTKFNKSAFLEKLFPFVAVGTIADVVPLLGENRYLVNKGLDYISKGKHEGLKRLLESAEYDITKGVTSEIVAFGIAPRINASGRLSTVDAALKLLISDNMQEVEMAIIELNELNTIRQRLCQDTYLQAVEMLKNNNDNPSIVLYHEDWNVGIVGIVASKLVERFYKPTFLMKFDKENHLFRCSARSVDKVPLYDVLNANSELFDGFGGHALAAGLSFDSEKVSFEQVKKSLNETISEYTSSQDIKPFIDIEMELTSKDITPDLVNILSELEPYGASNPNPIFAINNFKIKEKRLIGNDKTHLRLIVTDGVNDFVALWWKVGDIGLSVKDTVDIAFHPQINEFNGNISVQLIVHDIHSEVLDKKEKIQEKEENAKYKIFDHRYKTGILHNINDYIKNANKKITVFAESKSITDTLKPYPYITKNIKNRLELENCDAIMIFDYPANIENLNYIIKKSNAKTIHFMNYTNKTLDKTDLLKMISGMIKYAIKNNSGKIDIIRCISTLGKSEEVFVKLMDLLENNNIIKITDRNDTFYKCEEIDLSKIMDLQNNHYYLEIYEISKECEEFQKSLLTDDLYEILNCIETI